MVQARARQQLKTARRAEKEAEKKTGEVAAASQLERLISVGERIAFAVEHLAGFRGVRVPLLRVVNVANPLLACPTSICACDPSALRVRRVRASGDCSGLKPRDRYVVAHARRSCRDRTDRRGSKRRGRCVVAYA